MRIFGELTKIEDQPDGSIHVFGVASSGARDDAGEIVTPDAMKAALPDYAKYPALREMHQPSAAGRTLEAEVDAEGFTRIVAHVVDPVAIAKVKSKTYAGFSIGGKVMGRDPTDRTIITAIKLGEISLVDRPCNPEASLDLWKADLGQGDETPMAHAPTNDEVKARANDLAKAAGKDGAWKDYVAKAREALVADHEAAAVTEREAAEAAADALRKTIVAELDSRSVAFSIPRVAQIVVDKAAELHKSGADVASAVTDAIAQIAKSEDAGVITEVVAPSSESPDAAAILTAALEKAKEADKPAEPEPPSLDLVKVAAALRHIIAASDGKLTKGLWSVARLCEIIEALTWLQQDTTWEAAGENDDSAIPADIAAHIAGLLSCLNQMVAEESAEIVDAYQEQGMDVDLNVDGGDAVIIEAASQILDLAKADVALMEKVGARHSKADAAHIQASHDSMVKLGAMCDPQNTPVDEAEKTVKVDGLEKLAIDAADTITKALGKITDLEKTVASEPARTAAAIETALEKFRKEPAPPKTAASTRAAIGKAEDASPGVEPQAGSDDEITKYLGELSEHDRALVLIKAAHKLPHQPRA